MTKELEIAMREAYEDLEVLENNTMALDKIMPNQLGGNVIDYLLLGKHMETFVNLGIELYDALADMDVLTREDIGYNFCESLKEGGDGELEIEALQTSHNYFEYNEMGAYLPVSTDKALELLTYVIMVLEYRIEKLDNEPKEKTYRFAIHYPMHCEIDIKAASLEEATALALDVDIHYSDMFKGNVEVNFEKIVK